MKIKNGSISETNLAINVPHHSQIMTLSHKQTSIVVQHKVLDGSETKRYNLNSQAKFVSKCIDFDNNIGPVTPIFFGMIRKLPLW